MSFIECQALVHSTSQRPAAAQRDRVRTSIASGQKAYTRKQVEGYPQVMEVIRSFSGAGVGEEMTRGLRLAREAIKAPRTPYKREAAMEVVLGVVWWDEGLATRSVSRARVMYTHPDTPTLSSKLNMVISN